MRIYNYEGTRKTSREIKEAKKLREEYIQSHKAIWKASARPYVLAREVSRLKTNEIGNMIGTSEAVIKKFEKGEPIDRSQLIAQSYSMALNLIYGKKYGIGLERSDKMYSPIELLEYFIGLNWELGVVLIRDAVNSLNLSCKFDGLVDVIGNKNIHSGFNRDKEIMICDRNSGEYFSLFPKIS